ncbi:hypothetical protein C1X61_02055 [Pseudomonas sp. FW215-T2]|nr:hypothetical protein C1X61_02055 [Pseudomonas sp. FW215-T2]PNA16742.1 hypothetical protein C1X62_01270 [Pseudomonas sp. FW215-R3]PNB39645.1 hypothetical protein C1X63_01730 [Pseudomonas sp. FW305-131]
MVQCKASQDERAEINLVNQGYSCFRSTDRRERDLQEGGELRVLLLMTLLQCEQTISMPLLVSVSIEAAHCSLVIIGIFLALLRQTPVLSRPY